MEDCEVAVRSIEEVERDVEALTKQLSVLTLEAEDLERNTSFDLLVLIVLDAVILVLLVLRYEIWFLFLGDQCFSRVFRGGVGGLK
jgi:hypothetical protein